jgi:hypothetical protein
VRYLKGNKTRSNEKSFLPFYCLALWGERGIGMEAFKRFPGCSGLKDGGPD